MSFNLWVYRVLKRCSHRRPSDAFFLIQNYGLFDDSNEMFFNILFKTSVPLVSGPPKKDWIPFLPEYGTLFLFFCVPSTVTNAIYRLYVQYTLKFILPLNVQAWVEFYKLLWALWTIFIHQQKYNHRLLCLVLPNDLFWRNFYAMLLFKT